MCQQIIFILNVAKLLKIILHYLDNGRIFGRLEILRCDGIFYEL
jgi:hypothetical protein